MIKITSVSMPRSIVGIVVAIGWYLVSNTNANLAARRIATGFGFLDRVAGIPIRQRQMLFAIATDEQTTDE